MNGKLKLAVFAMALLLAGCAMGVKDDDPYAVRVRDMDQRLANIERVLKNQSLVQLVGRVEELQSEVRTLRGELETLRYDIDGVRQRQRDVYLDIDQRLQSIESGAGGGGSAGSSSGNGNDRDAYQEAFSLLRDARYEEAKRAFEQFIKDHPNSSLIPNAWYWLGEVNYVNKAFETAVGQFRKVVDDFPQSNKTADAWLKLGYCHYELQHWTRAKEALTAVVDQHSEHAATGLAKERLERMRREGR